jgi:hypothetical protein
MGFRDPKLFNLALLGKHGWRLLTDPNAICARVLKGRYYSNSEFMAATAPTNSSATWQAIIDGREALQLGLVKRIGDGSSVSVWQDSWIPGIRNLRPSIQTGDEEINKVAELIDPTTGSWKIVLIRRNFILSEADTILNIPLRRGGREDFWAWSLENSLENTGIYSVKTAYRSLVNRNEQRALDEGTITETSITDQ